jgi:4-hydroxybenzoate polyprenyltransferase
MSILLIVAIALAIAGIYVLAIKRQPLIGVVALVLAVVIWIIDVRTTVQQDVVVRFLVIAETLHAAAIKFYEYAPDLEVQAINIINDFAYVLN